MTLINKKLNIFYNNYNNYYKYKIYHYNYKNNKLKRKSIK